MTEYMPMPNMKATRLFVHTAVRRIMRMSISGCLARSATWNQATASTSVTTIRPKVTIKMRSRSGNGVPAAVKYGIASAAASDGGEYLSFTLGAEHYGVDLKKHLAQLGSQPKTGRSAADRKASAKKAAATRKRSASSAPSAKKKTAVKKTAPAKKAPAKASTTRKKSSAKKKTPKAG